MAGMRRWRWIGLLRQAIGRLSCDRWPGSQVGHPSPCHHLLARSKPHLLSCHHLLVRWKLHPLSCSSFIIYAILQLDTCTGLSMRRLWPRLWPGMLQVLSLSPQVPRHALSMMPRSWVLLCRGDTENWYEKISKEFCWVQQQSCKLRLYTIYHIWPGTSVTDLFKYQNV